uniref:hypothetical protein n=1 Tax=Paractinoplanes polyasparticus TaxID=2856853 RepID=UPI001C864D79|nr:hypothetical protein [Actinoplanes polyasparticus]
MVDAVLAFAILLPTVLLTIGLLIAGMQRGPSEPAPADPIRGPERMLAERLAGGEIDIEEYERRLHVLPAAQR